VTAPAAGRLTNRMKLAAIQNKLSVVIVGVEPDRDMAVDGPFRARMERYIAAAWDASTLVGTVDEDGGPASV
jgi:hypothetical protein